MTRLKTLLIVLAGMALGSSLVLAAEQAEQAADEAPAAAPATTGYGQRLAHQRALGAQQQAAHEARVKAMREESERFRQLSGERGMYMDPWARNMIAHHELQRRLMDPYGSSMLDRLEEDFWNRTAAYGERPEVADPHAGISAWARQQQQAIYDRSRQAQQNLAKAVQEGKVTFAPVVPWGVPYGGYHPYGWGAPYYGYGAPFFW